MDHQHGSEPHKKRTMLELVDSYIREKQRRNVTCPQIPSRFTYHQPGVQRKSLQNLPNAHGNSRSNLSRTDTPVINRIPAIITSASAISSASSAECDDLRDSKTSLDKASKPTAYHNSVPTLGKDMHSHISASELHRNPRCVRTLSPLNRSDGSIFRNGSLDVPQKQQTLYTTPSRRKHGAGDVMLDERRPSEVVIVEEEFSDEGYNLDIAQQPPKQERKTRRRKRHRKRQQWERPSNPSPESC